MKLNPILVATSLTALIFGSSGLANAALTMEQAEQLSKRTGRPILAVAGSKT